MRHGDRYPYGTRAYGVATYDKMAVNLMSLRAVLANGQVFRSPSAPRSSNVNASRRSIASGARS